MVRREQMLLHLIDLYVNCIQNLSVCFLGPLSTVLTGFLEPLNVQAGCTVVSSVFKHEAKDDLTFN